MDRPESNKNKAKTWLYRFFMIRTRPSSSSSDTEPSADASYIRTRSSFRRSLKKMQTRVKSCVFPQRNRSPNPEDEVQRACSLDIPPPVVARVLENSATLNRDSNNSLKSVELGNHRIPTDEILSLSTKVWYWGPMTTAEAEEKLRFKPDGTFLVRDSSSTSYLFSISFRSVGKTMHARIEYSRGKYNLYGTFKEGFSTITELIENAVKVSEDGVYCYSRRGNHDCDFPVRLTKPISRYTEVRSLKYLCKFVIRQRTNINDIPKLPLPTVLYSYLLEGPYF